MASQFVVMTLPFAIYLSLTAKKQIGYWLANPLIALMLAYIVYGRARQAFVALFVQILIMLVAICFTRSRQLLAPRSLTKDYFFSIIASLILFVSLALAPPYDKPFSWEQSAVSEFASRTEVFTKQDATLQEISNGRYATWIKTASMIRNHPAGVGLNNWTVHFPKYNAEAGDYYYQSLGNDVWEDAHNDYLQILAELGLTSLLIAGLLILGLWKIYHLIWTKGDETSQRHSLFFGMGLMALFTVMIFSFPLQRTAQPVYLGIYLAMIAAMASLSLSLKAEKRVAFGPAAFVVLLLSSVVSTYIGYREISGWNHAFLARALGEAVFKPGENNPYATRRIMLALAKLTEKSMELEPYAPRLLTDYIITYNFLAQQIGHERLAAEYRSKSFDIAKRYLATSPYDGHIHKIVATSLQVPTKTAMEHIGKAIALDPGNLQLYEYLRGIAFPAEKFAQALTYYEYYIPRFYNQRMNEEYAYIGKKTKQEERVINTLSRIDLSRKFAPGSGEYTAARKRIDELLDDLQRGL
ncbi:O-antigen ligase family protein [Pseudomonadota bacterium]